MIALPVLKAEDQGLLEWLRYTFKVKKKPQHSLFDMTAKWQDPKYYGEGTAYCEGNYASSQNYHFSKIFVEMTSPRKETLTVLDSDIVEI